MIKAFYFSSKTNQAKSETRFWRQKTAEDNAKIKVSSNITCSFLLFKASPFLQIFFPRNLLCRQALRTSVFINTCLTFLYLFTSLLKNIYEKYQINKHIPLFINQFVSLVELKGIRETPNWKIPTHVFKHSHLSF